MLSGMDREAMGRLRTWKTSSRRKPLLLEGPRQVGKTWLLKQFGQQEYRHTAYLDFEQDPALRAVFDGDFDVTRMLSQLQLASGAPIQPSDTLIVLDEIQACPRALTALKYLNENANEYHIACAGSLLGVALHEQASFPVGKVNFLAVNPLTFAEYLSAINQAPLAQAVAEQDWGVLRPFHERLVEALREYLFVGGMPEAVAVFAQGRDFAAARGVQLEILTAYDHDFSKHAPSEQVPRIRAVWQSIPAQLARQQRRFTYSQVSPGARGRTHLAAIDWLAQAGVVHQVCRVSVPRLPLSGYADATAFKLFLADVGLLGALSGLGASAVIEGDRMFTEFSGSLTEQYAEMALHAAFGRTPYFWTNGEATAEVDFVVQREHDVVPVEVKANRNLKAQSLRVYREKFVPELSVRSSLAPYSVRDGLVDLPLYALGGLPSLATRMVGRTA